MRGTTLLSIGVFVAAFVAFVAVNMLAAAGLRSARLDLTDGRLYTLSTGSRNIAASLQEPIRFSLYYSEQQTADLPAQVTGYAQRVREVLAEYANASRGKIVVQYINPEPFSDAEDKAVAAGLLGLPAGPTGGQRFYFGLVATNSTDKQEVIPFFRPDREEFLEYELTRIVNLLSEAKRPTIGVMSWLPIQGGEFNPMTRQQPPPAWQVATLAREMFNLRTVPPTAAEIPRDINVLWIVHPKNPSEATLYAIDQFVLRGGRLLVFVDPNCEADIPPGVNPMQAMGLPKNSDLPRLFEKWGVELVPGSLAADRDAAIRVNAGGQGRSEPVDYVLWLSLGSDNLNRQDAVTGQLRTLNIATAGILRRRDGAGTTFQPLVSTGPNAAIIGADRVSFMPDPRALLADYKSGGSPLVIAARITGKVRSAFDGPPAPAPAASPDQPPPAPPAGPHIAESAEPANIIIVADCDMLQDRFWIEEQRLGQIVLGLNKFADNGDLAIGALDNLSGSSDLISVRSRGTFQRPFNRVNQLRREAEQRYLATELALQNKLRETQTKIDELQRSRTDAQSTANSVILTPEQQAEIEKFRAEQVQTRKQLRDVQHQLNKDIEGLGRTVKLVNIWMMPALVGLAAVGLGAWRARRRRQDRHAPTARG